jgi:hypothetical protein
MIPTTENHAALFPALGSLVTCMLGIVRGGRVAAKPRFPDLRGTARATGQMTVRRD